LASPHCRRQEEDVLARHGFVHQARQRSEQATSIGTATSIAPQFAKANPFSQGSRVGEPGPGFSPEDSRGLIDRTGKYVVEPRFTRERLVFPRGSAPSGKVGTWRGRFRGAVRLQIRRARR
jgi:hypothetical protein